MKLPPLHRGTLLRRYKRFLADVRLEDGREVVAHCPNPGRMTSCQEPGWTVWLSHHDSPKRKLKWSWELSETPAGVLILVNTARPNTVAKEGALRVPQLAGFGLVRSEVRMGEGSRVDLHLSEGPGPDAWVEVKSVTLLHAARRASFPDAVSARASKHLDELRARVDEGERGVLLFLLSREDAEVVSPADAVDPVYGRKLRAAAAAGVEVLAHKVLLSREELRLGPAVPVDLTGP